MESIRQDEAKKMMDELKGEYFLLDCRHAHEYALGHLPGAHWIDNDDVDMIKGHEKLPEDLDLPIFVYCRSGMRSKRCAAKLDVLGYGEVYEIGGIVTWPYEIEGRQ